jgi:hypothetical protein
MEARVGVEPTNGGFADLSLRPLGYRAVDRKYIESPAPTHRESVTWKKDAPSKNHELKQRHHFWMQRNEQRPDQLDRPEQPNQQS